MTWKRRASQSRETLEMTGLVEAVLVVDADDDRNGRGPTTECHDVLVV